VLSNIGNLLKLLNHISHILPKETNILKFINYSLSAWRVTTYAFPYKVLNFLLCKWKLLYVYSVNLFLLLGDLSILINITINYFIYCILFN
jgi:hypothetical protein